MSKNYNVYNLNDETLIILPGTRFTKNELLSRLQEINIDGNNCKDKKELASLYDSYIMDDRNKFLLINRLRKDTEFFKSKLEISQCQSIFGSNANTISNNPKNKILNISYDVKPFNENKSIQQEIVIKNPNNVNTRSNNQNTYISSNTNQNQENGNYRYTYNDNQLRNNYSNGFSGGRNFQNNNQSNINAFYNNNYIQSQISIQNKDENSTNIMNKKMYNTNNSMKNNIIDNKGYSNYNNKDNINYNQKNEEEINPILKRNENNIILQDNLNNQKIFTNVKMPNPINSQNFKSYSNNNQIDNNTYKNINNFKNVSLHSNQESFQEDSSQKMIIEKPRQSIISNEEDQENERIPSNKREPYEEPVLLSLVIVLITIGQIFLIYKYWNSIIELLTNPSRIIPAIFGFVSSLFFGSINHLQIIIPLLLLIVIMVVLYQKFVFDKRCKEILKKVKEYLLNNQNNGENNNITDDEIYQRFVQNYGISYEEFLKKYIKALRKIRRDIPGLKMSGQNINGKEIMTWFLN